MPAGKTFEDLINIALHTIFKRIHRVALRESPYAPSVILREKLVPTGETRASYEDQEVKDGMSVDWYTLRM